MLITPAPTAEVPEELIDRALATDVKAAFLLTGVIAPAMAARGGGAVVTMGWSTASAGRPIQPSTASPRPPSTR
jgi:NAD(P)-dependent dehydrogenase (short-subunit alcohol dehydrogenase family)